jgi:lycopene cyclase domain-containing protein
MKEKFLYLLLDAFTLSVPLLRSFESKIAYYKSFGSLFKAIAITGVFFVVWDALFTFYGIWGFNERFLVGVSILLLPIEEWLFFIVVPFSCIFIYRVLNYFLGDTKSRLLQQQLPAFLVWFPLGVAVLNYQRAYTFTNFLLLGLFMGWHIYINKTAWLGNFMRAYAIILIPFLLVNSVLTGSWIDEPIVWYNDLHHLGKRIGTIPMEDAFYGLLLILMNLSLYEFFESKRKKDLSRP